MEDWEFVDGYNNDNDYADDVACQIDSENKTISQIKSQTLIAGERNSQYIPFQMPRYYDGIDLSKKSIQIIFAPEIGEMGIDVPINVKRNAEFISFGWLVSDRASAQPGALSFCIEFTSDGYSLKTKPLELDVNDSMQGDVAVPEPTEQPWYIEIQSRCDTALQKAEEILETAQPNKKTWRHIASYTADSDVSQIDITVDENGKPFLLEKVRAFLVLPKVDKSYLYSFGVDTQEGVYGLTLDENAKKTDNWAYCINLELTDCLQGVLNETSHNWQPDSYEDYGFMGMPIAYAYNLATTKIEKISLYDVSEQTFAAGATIEVWGVDV